APGGTVEVILFSDPVNLGQYNVESDGSLNINVQIPPSVPAGYHTLVVKGETPSGEEIHYEQIILVKGGDPNDIDEDSTPDDQQPCGPFMAVSGVDEDLDGIDDACDPEIAEAPEIYRGRLDGANRISIERNIRASILTGINEDDDPDGDGWAVVGVSGDGQLVGIDAGSEGAVDFEVLGDG